MEAEAKAEIWIVKKIIDKLYLMVQRQTHENKNMLFMQNRKTT